MEVEEKVKAYYELQREIRDYLDRRWLEAHNNNKDEAEEAIAEDGRACRCEKIGDIFEYLEGGSEGAVIPFPPNCLNCGGVIEEW